MRLTCLLLTVTALCLAAGCDKKSEATATATSAASTATKTAHGTASATSAASTATKTAHGTASVTSAPAKVTTATKTLAANTLAVEKGADLGHAAGKKVPGCLYEDGKKKAGECPSEAAPTATSKAAAARGIYGMPLTLKSGSPLTKAIENFDAKNKELQQFVGTIGEVCKKKGCWFTLQDGTHQARVMMRDPKYFTIPIKSSGKKVVIEGRLKERVFTEANVKHIEDDAGRDPSKVSGSRKEYVIMARSVAIDG